MVTKGRGQSQAAETSTELVKSELPENAIQEVGSYLDAMRLLTEELGAEQIGDSLDLGDGYPILDDKGKLEGQSLIFIDWTFIPSDKVPALKEGEELWPGRGFFTTARVVTSDNRKFRVNDGSRGMHQQLWEYSQKTGRQVALVARGGLKGSHYTLDDGTTGLTYYIDTSA